MKKIVFGVIMALVFIGCGGGTNGPDNGSATKGTVYDDLVENLEYKTMGFISKTDWKGRFSYLEGGVDFYLGKLKIGSISRMTSDKKVFLSDMLGLQRGNYKDATLVKVARLIQSFNLLPASANKITLDIDTINSIFNDASMTLENVDLNSLPITYVVSKEEAMARVKATYERQGITPLD